MKKLFSVLLLLICIAPLAFANDLFQIGIYYIRGTGMSFMFPTSQSRDINGMTRACQSIEGKTSITVRYRIDADEGVQIKPSEAPNWPNAGLMFLYFQRRGDDFSTEGKFEKYRWYSGRGWPLLPGEHTVTYRFDQMWGATIKSTNVANPKAFKKAMRNCSRIGFALGGGPYSKGHGVISVGNGRAQFTLISYTVE